MSVAVIAVLAGLQVQTEWIEAPVPDEVARVESRTVERGPGGAIWIGVRGQGLVQVTEQGLRWYSADDGLASNDVADLMHSSGGVLWAGGRNGVSSMSAGRWTPQRAAAGSALDVVFGVAEGPTGAVWLATSDGAVRIEGDSTSRVRQVDGLPHIVVHAVIVDPTGATWFACRRGLARLIDGTIEVLFPDINFRTALAGPDGDLWFGTSDGVYRWNGSRWDVQLRGRTVLPRLLDSQDAVWAVTPAGELLRHSDGAWSEVSVPSRFADAELLDVAEAADGSIWFTSVAGTGRLRSR